MLRRVSIKNFRNISVDNLELSRINLLIGPNNSGKSNFIHSINLLKDYIITDGSFKTNRPGYDLINWAKFFNRRKVFPSHMSFDLDVKCNTEVLNYKLEMLVDKPEIRQNGLIVTSERLGTYRRDIFKSFDPYFVCHEDSPGVCLFYLKNADNGKPISIDVGQGDSVFHQCDILLQEDTFRVDVWPMFREKMDSLLKVFMGFNAYILSDMSSLYVREASPKSLAARYLNSTATNLINVLWRLDNDSDFIENCVHVLSEAIPSLNKIKIVSLGEQYHDLVLTINKDRFRLKELSDGTIKLLILVILLFSPEKYSVLSLDEPETNLHPAWLRLLATWMLKNESSQQLFISTHSPDLLDGFTQAFRDNEVSLFVFSDKNQITRMTPDKLDVFFSEGWELGDLYRVGEPRLGGWPW